MAVLCTASLGMQAQSFQRLDAAHMVQAPMNAVNMTGEEIIPYQPLTSHNVGDIDHLEIREIVIQRQVIGYTQYDLQSNYAVDDRVVSSSGGVSAGWICSIRLMDSMVTPPGSVMEMGSGSSGISMQMGSATSSS